MDIPSYLLGKSKGGGGGTSDYSQLTNKPSINGVTLNGNKTSEDLGISAGTKTYYINYYSNYDTTENKATLKEIYNELKNDNTKFNIIGIRNNIINSAVSFYISGNSLYVEFAEVDYGNGARLGVVRLIYYNSNNTVTQNNANKSTVMNLDSMQTITGRKTFNTLPESSVTPTTNTQFTNKAYVDSVAGGGSSLTKTIINMNQYGQIDFNTENTTKLLDIGNKIINNDIFDLEICELTNNNHLKLQQYQVGEYNINYFFLFLDYNVAGQFSELMPAHLYVLEVNYSDSNKTSIISYSLTNNESYLVTTEFKPYAV